MNEINQIISGKRIGGGGGYTNICTVLIVQDSPWFVNAISMQEGCFLCITEAIREPLYKIFRKIESGIFQEFLRK